MLPNRLLTESPAPEGRDYPSYAANIPSKEICEGPYRLRFVESRSELDAVLKLRFEVFNIELGEGLDASYLTGRDWDAYDLTCHHLSVWDVRSGEPVGTYRIQTSAMAAAAGGFYSATEFDLKSLPSPVVDNSVELGRACIAQSHRNTQVLFLLWKGLAAYLQHNQKRYLFGCCSLTSQNQNEGLGLYDSFKAEGQVHTEFVVLPKPGYECREDGRCPGSSARLVVPRLFRTYLRFGAKVCGPPAIDRRFRTIDFLVLFDVAELAEMSRRMFFGG